MFWLTIYLSAWAYTYGSYASKAECEAAFVEASSQVWFAPNHMCVPFPSETKK